MSKLELSSESRTVAMNGSGPQQNTRRSRKSGTSSAILARSMKPFSPDQSWVRSSSVTMKPRLKNGM